MLLLLANFVDEVDVDGEVALVPGAVLTVLALVNLLRFILGWRSCPVLGDAVPAQSIVAFSDKVAYFTLVCLYCVLRFYVVFQCSRAFSLNKIIKTQRLAFALKSTFFRF